MKLVTTILTALSLASLSAAPQVNLTWDDNSDNEVGFVVERSTNGSDFHVLHTTQADATSHVDNTVEANRDYWYRVRAFNAAGNSAPSNVASIHTLPQSLPPAAPQSLHLTQPGELVNISTRGLVRVGAEIQIGGFVVQGGPVTVLIRGVGPGLERFDLGGLLADPRIELKNAAGATIADNDNWSDVAVAEAAADIGAFTLEAGSKDAALVATLQPGSYTVHLMGVNGTTGLALLEIYKVP